MLLKGLNGDEESYRLFLLSIVPCLRALSCNYLDDRFGETESFVQEILLAIHQKRATYREGMPVSSWLYAIATYKLASNCHPRTSARIASTQASESLFSSLFLESATSLIQ
jgi:DNA-directed RNA polymerase specialized sigma24 family protein